MSDTQFKIYLLAARLLEAFKHIPLLWTELLFTGLKLNSREPVCSSRVAARGVVSFRLFRSFLCLDVSNLLLGLLELL